MERVVNKLLLPQAMLEMSGVENATANSGVL